MTESTTLESGVRILQNTARTVETLIGETDTRIVVLGLSSGYFLLYSVIVGQLTSGGGSIDVFVVSDPMARMFQRTGAFVYEPIAMIDLAVVSYLFSPFNFGFAVGLSILVALNLSVSYLLWRYPRACDIGSTSASAGVVASLPALLSGAACCGPIVLIVLGIQATGFLLTAFNSLLPVAVALLVVTLVYTTTKVDYRAIR